MIESKDRRIRLGLSKAMIFLLSFLAVIVLLASTQAANVVVTSNQVAVVAGQGLPGLISRALPNGAEKVFPLPFQNGQITGFEDVAIDEADPTTVFAFSENDKLVCTFTISSTDGSLSISSCVVGFHVGPYTGIAVKNGILVISGGTGGVTVYNYTVSTRTIDSTPTLLNKLPPNAVGCYGVLMISNTLVALSTDFGAFTPEFGTLMVDPSLNALYSFRVQNSLGTTLSIAPSNFPLVNTVYTTNCGETFMYTANGALTIQNAYQSGTTTEMTFSDGFQAVTDTVDQTRGLLVVGGVMSDGSSQIRFFSLETARSPALQSNYTITDGRRITSVALTSTLLVYAFYNGTTTEYGWTTNVAPGFSFPAPLCTPAPTRSATMLPTPYPVVVLPTPPITTSPPQSQPPGTAPVPITPTGTLPTATVAPTLMSRTTPMSMQPIPSGTNHSQAPSGAPVANSTKKPSSANSFRHTILVPFLASMVAYLVGWTMGWWL